MKIVCAWCGKSLGEKGGRGERGVSHGLCRGCLARVKAAAEKRVSENGDSEPPPTRGTSAAPSSNGNKTTFKVIGDEIWSRTRQVKN